MAQTENGVGISWKFHGNDMIWARRDTWAELAEDIRLIKGNEYLQSLEASLKGGTPVPSVSLPPGGATAVTTSDALTPEQAAAELGGELSSQTFSVCPACGALKDKLVPAGTSKRTGKAYPAFYGCPTRGCPGK